MDRIIALIDMDCFYVQVEQRLNPDLMGKPCAVVQYNGWRGGGLIAVNYEARDVGVTRYLRGDDAQKICPEIELVRVPEVNGKADLTKYRDAGREVIDTIKSFASIVERASIDEAYIDLTDEVKEINANLQSNPLSVDQFNNSYVVDWEEDGEQSVDKEHKEISRKKGIMTLLNLDDDQIINLLIGARLVERIRSAILEKTGFKCSAGISHNKVLSKLACGINKPNKQTIIPAISVPLLFSTTPIKKIRNLGGKLGDTLKESGIEMMSDISKYPSKELQKKFGEKNGAWLYYLAQGIDSEPVKPRQLAQSIGCSKLFPGKNALTTEELVRQWLQKLATEIEDRLKKDQDMNNRLASLLNLHVNLRDDLPAVSRSCPLTSFSAAKIASQAYQVLTKLNKSSDGVSWSPAIVSLGMSASKFKDVEGTSVTFMKSFFQSKNQTDRTDINMDTDSQLLSSVQLKDAEGPSTSIKSYFQPKSTSFKTDLINAAITELPSVSKSAPSFFSKLKAQISVSPPKLSTPSTSIQAYSSIAINPAESSSDSNSSDKLTTNNDDEDEVTSGYIHEDTSTVSSHKNDSATYENERSDSPLDLEDYYTCDKCQKSILVWNQFEHEDYHLAVQIQSEIEPISNQVARQPPPIKSPSASKRKSKTHKKGPVVKTRSITSYFQKQEPTNN